MSFSNGVRTQLLYDKMIRELPVAQQSCARIRYQISQFEGQPSVDGTEDKNIVSFDITMSNVE